jgi:hypothetical protein
MKELQHAHPLQVFDQDEGEELKNNPPSMDYEPHVVHPLECDEYSTLWKEPGD